MAPSQLYRICTLLAAISSTSCGAKLLQARPDSAPPGTIPAPQESVSPPSQNQPVRPEQLLESLESYLCLDTGEQIYNPATEPQPTAEEIRRRELQGYVYKPITVKFAYRAQLYCPGQQVQ